MELTLAVESRIFIGPLGGRGRAGAGDGDLGDGEREGGG